MSRKPRPQAPTAGPRIEVRALAGLTPAPYNPRRISPEAMAGLRASVRRFGLVQPIIVNERTGHVVGGHQRIAALVAEGATEAQVVVVDLPPVEEKALNVALNSQHIAGEFTEDLDAMLDEIRTSDAELFEDLRLDALLAEVGGLEPATTPAEARLTLAERFGVPPFSVLDARQGYWQDRKRAWLALGIESELGRGMENLSGAHPETTATVDFYAQKRAMEAKLGRTITKDEAAAEMESAGTLKNARAVNKRRGGLMSETVQRLKPSADPAATGDRRRKRGG